MSPTAIFWLAIIAVVFISGFFSSQARMSRHRMIEKLAEKGQPIPPELFSNVRLRYDRDTHPIASGIYLMCIGIALFIFFWAMMGLGNPFADRYVADWSGRSWLPFVGIFPFMVGLARVLTGFFMRRRADDK